MSVPVNLKAKKQLVARMYKVGVNRVVFDSDHLDDVADAITRENIRSLFAHQLFIRPSAAELEDHEPELTVMCINDFEAVID